MNSVKMNSFADAMEYFFKSIEEFGLAHRKETGRKPSYLEQCEKFQSMIDKAMEKYHDTVYEKIQTKVMMPIYENHILDFSGKITDESGRIQDGFIRLADEPSRDLTIRSVPKGMYLEFHSRIVPISEIYTRAVKFSLRSDDRPPYPNKILLGLFYMIQRTLVEQDTGSESLEAIQKNITVLEESLEELDEPEESSQQGFLGGLFNGLFQNEETKKISESFQNFVKSDNFQEQFGTILSSVQDVVKNADTSNPMEMISNLAQSEDMKKMFNDLSMKQASSQESEAERSEASADPSQGEPLALSAPETE